MFSVFRTLSLRYLSKRWFRAILIVASIALGVSTLIATQALNRTMSLAALAAANPLAGIADLTVSNDDLPLSGEIAGELLKVPGVQSARPLLTGKVSLPDFKDAEGKEREILVLGLDMEAEFMQTQTFATSIKLLPDQTQVIFQFLLFRGLGQYPVVLGRFLAQDLGIVEKDGIPAAKSLLKVRNRSRVRIGEKATNVYPVLAVGVMEGTGDSAPLSGPVMVLDLRAANTILDYPPGQVQRIDIVLTPEADIIKVREDVEAIVARRGIVRTPQEQNESIQSVMRGMQTGFSLCGIAALVVGMFLVYNSLSVSVAERRHEIGVLLSLGATRGQVWRLFAGEAALLGLAGSLLGIPLGIGLAHLGLGPMQQMLQDIFYSIDSQTVEVPRNLLFLAVGVGMATAIFASLVPAFAASRETPAEAVRRVVKAPSARKLFAQAALSVFLILLGLTIIFLRDVFPRRFGTYGGVSLMLIGSLVSAPFLAAGFTRILQPIVRRFLGIEWRLAADNLVRAPGRTGLVIGALAAGVALVVQTAGVILSNQTAINNWVEEYISADIIVTSGGLVGAGGALRPMDPGLGPRLKTLSDEIADVLPVRMLKVPFQETRIAVVALDARRASEIERSRTERTHARFYNLLVDNANAVIASKNFAAIFGYRVGDVVTLPGQRGGVDLKIVAVIEDYTWNHGSLIMSRDDYLKHWNDEQVDVFDVFLKNVNDTPANVETRRLAVKKQINDELKAAYDLHILTRPELQGRIHHMIGQIYGIAYGQQIVVMVVAALGVVTSLLISVLQRRREMGLLRAIGASRGQVVRSVLCEACLMGIIGTTIGILIGIPLQWYVLRVIILDESGFLFPMYIPWKQALFIGMGSMLTATLAGLGPALYAVRQRIPDAIAYE